MEQRTLEQRLIDNLKNVYFDYCAYEVVYEKSKDYLAECQMLTARSEYDTIARFLGHLGIKLTPEQREEQKQLAEKFYK